MIRNHSLTKNYDNFNTFIPVMILSKTTCKCPMRYLIICLTHAFDFGFLVPLVSAWCCHATYTPPQQVPSLPCPHQCSKGIYPHLYTICHVNATIVCLTGFCPGSKCCHTTSTPPQQVPCACHHIKTTHPHPHSKFNVNTTVESAYTQTTRVVASDIRCSTRNQSKIIEAQRCDCCSECIYYCCLILTDVDFH